MFNTAGTAIPNTHEVYNFYFSRSTTSTEIIKINSIVSWVYLDGSTSSTITRAIDTTAIDLANLSIMVIVWTLSNCNIKFSYKVNTAIQSSFTNYFINGNNFGIFALDSDGVHNNYIVRG